MKNRIWAGKSRIGEQFTCTEKMILGDSGYFFKNEKEMWRLGLDAQFNYDYADLFGLGLKNGEIVEIIIDTETQKYEVKRPREIGWYLTERATNTYAVARFWNGENWCCKPNDRRTYETIHDEQIKVVSEIIRDNKYLKSLE